MKKKIVISIFSILVLFVTGIWLIYYCNEKVIITLNGERSISLDLNKEYKDEGAVARVCSFNKCKDVTDTIVIKEDIDVNTIGQYKIIYEVKYNDNVYTKERLVRVFDKVSPVIELIGNKNVELCPNDKYKEEGYKATDNYDGDITDNVRVLEEDGIIKYSVIDSSSNNFSINREIKKVDKVKPVIKLKGSGVITLKQNEKYNEPGVSVTDNCEKLDSNKVNISHNIDTSKVGTYNVRYTIKDSSGNVGTANRTVKVKKPVSFDTVNKKEYQESLEAYIKDKNYNVSIGYVNLKTGYTYLYNEKVVYYGASLVKTVDALYVYEKMDFNETTRKRVEKAISVSNNQAHNQLVNQIGISNLRKYGRSLGASNFLTRSDKDYFGNTTVKDQIAIWKHLYKVVNTNPKGQELKKYFINDYWNYLLFDGIPTTMHKYGLYGNFYHDVGIVYSDNPYLVVILTKHGDNNYRSVVKDLSKKIYDLNKIDD